MGTLDLPTYGITVDVYHNNELRNVILLDQNAGGSPIHPQTMILWDDISTPDQQKLIDLVAQYDENIIAPVGSPGTGGSPPVAFAGWHTVKLVGGGTDSGLANDGTVYSVTVTRTVAGGSPLDPIPTTQTIGIVGSNAQTFATVVSELDAAAEGVTVSLDTGNIRFEHDTAGLGTTVEIQVGGGGIPLFTPASPLNGFGGFFVKRAGVDTALEMFQQNRNNANVLFSDCYQLYVRPAKPPIGVSPNDINRTYFDGTIWRRLVDDAPI